MDHIGAVLILILVLALWRIAHWPHSKNWGYYPTGGVGLILMIVVVLVLIGRI